MGKEVGHHGFEDAWDLAMPEGGALREGEQRRAGEREGWLGK